MRLIHWMSKAHSRALTKQVSTDPVVVGSVKEFIDAPRDAKTVSFIDMENLEALDRLANDLSSATDQPTPAELRKLMTAISVGPLVAISNDPIGKAVGWLPSHPWLSHVMSSSMIEDDTHEKHLGNLITTLTSPNEPRLLDWLRPAGAGRRVRLTHASKRAERLERMTQFFRSHGIAEATAERVRQAGDELLTNAFYAAPVAAGAEHNPIPKSQDVALPDDFACDVAYGARGKLALVRVRDPFGSLTRQVLLDAVSRRSGSAATGITKVFAIASVIGVSVVTNRHTEILVGIGDPVASERRPYAVHLFFRGGPKRGFWKMIDGDTGIPALAASVTVTSND